MTKMLKGYMHIDLDHGCWQICLAFVEFEDYFGGRCAFTHIFQRGFSIPFLLCLFHLPFSSSVMQSQEIFFGPFIFH